MKKSILLILISVSCAVQAQVRINGKAPAYTGMEISLVTAADYISGRGNQITTVEVDKNGTFCMVTDVQQTGKYKLVCNSTEAVIYLDPNSTYGIEFPAAEGKTKGEPIKYVAVLFDTLPILDINNLVLDFNSRADEFIYYNYNILGSEVFDKRLDTFKLYLSKVYKDVTHSYFADYVAYSVAEMELLGPAKKDQAIIDVNICNEYLNSHGVKYHNDKYMDFFNKFFEGMFKEIHPGLESKLVNAINFSASPTLIDRVLQKDALLTNKRIRELVMIKCLKEEYYNREYLNDQILVVLDSIARFSTFDEHRKIAANVIQQYTWLQPGFMAPDFALRDNLDSLVRLSKLTNRYVYIGFWSLENTHAVNELRLMVQLHKKYKEYVTFVLINTDKDPKAWKEFLKKNPDYKWINLHAGSKDQILNDYKVTALPLYYLVDPKGVMRQSPALAPTPNGTFKSIDYTFHTITQSYKGRKRTNVGERDD